LLALGHGTGPRLGIHQSVTMFGYQVVTIGLLASSRASYQS
jgi:hypothetical protein